MDLVTAGRPAPSTSLSDLPAEVLNNVFCHLFDPAAAEFVHAGRRRYRFDMSILRINKAFHHIAKSWFDKELDWVHFVLDMPNFPFDANDAPVFYEGKTGVYPPALMEVWLTIPTPAWHALRSRKFAYVLGRDLPAFLLNVRYYDLMFSEHYEKTDEAYDIGEHGMYCGIHVATEAQPVQYAPLLKEFAKLNGPNNICKIKGCSDPQLEAFVATSVSKASDLIELALETIDHSARATTMAAKISTTSPRSGVSKVYALAHRLLRDNSKFVMAIKELEGKELSLWSWYHGFLSDLEGLIQVNCMLSSCQASTMHLSEPQSSSNLGCLYCDIPLVAAYLPDFIADLLDHIQMLQPDNTALASLFAVESLTSSFGIQHLEEANDIIDHMFTDVYNQDGYASKIMRWFQNPRLGPFRLIIGEDNIPEEVRDKFTQFLTPVLSEKKEERTLLAWKAPCVESLEGKQYYIG